MVADDEPEILRSLKIMLEDEGYEVITARNGQECLQAFKTGLTKSNNQFDLVLLDYRMPILDGLQVAKQILSLSPNQKLIMITAYSGVLEINEEKLKKMKIMAKPFDFDDLLSTVSELLKN